MCSNIINHFTKLSLNPDYWKTPPPEYQEKLRILRDQQIARAKDIVVCECGSVVQRVSLRKHKKSIKHFRFTQEKLKQI